MATNDKYDYAKLLGRIKEYGYTQETLAKAVHISPTSLNLSLNSKRPFRQEEIRRSCLLLDIPLQEVGIYFFSHEL